MDDKTFKSLPKPQQDVVLKIAAEAERQGVNPKLAIAVAQAESGFNQYEGDGILTSSAGARGVMQLLPSTVDLYNKNLNAGIDPDDVDGNIKGGVFILKDLLTKYKSPRIAVAMYNASPKANAEFVKQYETNPDAAIMSLKPETRKYSLKISQNFNLDDDNETGLINTQAQAESPKGGPVKEDNPNNPFAAGVPLADKAREASGAEEEKKEPTTLAEKASALFNEVEPAYGAVAGAVANVAGSKFVKPPLTPAEIDSLSAEKKLELSRQALQRAAPSGTADLEDAFKQSQSELDRLKNEQKLAEARRKGLPKAPPVVEPPAPSSPFPQVVREGRASGPKIEGDSGTRNWMIQEAGQQHQLPEAILDVATGKTKDSPTGGKALIDQDLRNLEKIKQLGAGDYGLVTTEGGVQLQLPPTTVAERQADIDRQSQANQAELERKTEETRIQQEAQARAFQQQQLAYEAEVERIRQERARLGQQHNAITGELKDIKPLKKAVTAAEQAAELAKYKASLKAQNQPLTPQDILNKGKTVGRTVAGGAAGYYGVMSAQQALERYNAGDRSEAVMQALGALSAGASLAPPVTPKLSGVKKLGALGAVGLGGREIWNRLTQEPPAQ
jgi:hypothetical protein